MAGKRDEVTIAEVAEALNISKNNGIPRNIRQGPRERGYPRACVRLYRQGPPGCSCAAAHCAAGPNQQPCAGDPQAFYAAGLAVPAQVHGRWQSACTTCCKRLWSTATSPVSAQAVFWWLSPSPSCLSSCRSSMLRALPPVQQRAKPLHQLHMAQ